jgi:hypothetical protein
VPLLHAVLHRQAGAVRGGWQQRPVPPPPPAGAGPRRGPRHGSLTGTWVPLTFESTHRAALESASLLQQVQSLVLLSTELDPNQLVLSVKPVLSSMQTGTGGHDDARSDRYDPSTWREPTGNSSSLRKGSSARGCKASWHGKLGVVANTQRFLDQLQRRQQASSRTPDLSYVQIQMYET